MSFEFFFYQGSHLVIQNLIIHFRNDLVQYCMIYFYHYFNQSNVVLVLGVEDHLDIVNVIIYLYVNFTRFFINTFMHSQFNSVFINFF